MYCTYHCQYTYLLTPVIYAVVFFMYGRSIVSMVLAPLTYWLALIFHASVNITRGTQVPNLITHISARHGDINH